MAEGCARPEKLLHCGLNIPPPQYANAHKKEAGAPTPPHHERHIWPDPPGKNDARSCAALIALSAVALVALLNLDWNRARPWLNGRGGGSQQHLCFIDRSALVQVKEHLPQS